MKKTAWISLLLAVAMVLGTALGGCQQGTPGSEDQTGEDQQTQEGQQTQEDQDPQEQDGNGQGEEPEDGKQGEEPEDGKQDEEPQDTQEPEGDDIHWYGLKKTGLSDRELAKWAATLYSETEGCPWTRNDPADYLCGLFGEYWSDPTEINLAEFLAYFPSEPLGDDEIAAMAESRGMTVQEFVEWSMQPYFSVDASEVNRILTKCLRITWDQVKGAEEFKYDAEKDRFIVQVSDVGIGFLPLSGQWYEYTKIEDYKIVPGYAKLCLYSKPNYTGDVVTIEYDKDGWKILSFLPGEEGT